MRLLHLALRRAFGATAPAPAGALLFLPDHAFNIERGVCPPMRPLARGDDERPCLATRRCNPLACIRVCRADARRCATPLRGRGDSARVERWHATRRAQFGLLFITPALR